MKSFIIFKSDTSNNVDYIEVNDADIAKVIDSRCLNDNEYIIIKGTLVKNIEQSRLVITPNLISYSKYRNY